jgi:GAF domain-containing protein
MTVQTELSRRAQLALSLCRAALDPGNDRARLDELVQSAALTTQAQAGSLSMLTDRQITAAVSKPLDELTHWGVETAFEDTMCAKVLTADETLVINDTAEDPRVSSVPAAAGGHVRAYLGAPLRTTQGDIVGVLCVFDSVPREWTPDQVAEVTRLAGLVIDELVRMETQESLT